MSQRQTLRQILIGTTLTICCISDGYIFGQMSGMVDAFKSKDSSIVLTDDDISWIASTINVLCPIGFVFMGTIANFFGRKKSIAIVNVPVVATWILVYSATDKTMLLLSRILLGVCFGGVLFVVFIAIGEYKPPNIRPLCMNLITCVGGLIGTTLGHVLSIVLHWRYVALIGIIPSGLAVILPFFWVESPAWLASKGRFEECEKAFRALHLSNEATEEELKLLLTVEKIKQNEKITKGPILLQIKMYIMVLTKKYFWRVSILGLVICIYRIASGRIFFSTLAITMLHDITGTSDILFFTLVIDGFTTAAAVLGCFILTKFQIRHILFISGTIANICLVIFASTLYIYSYNDYYSSWIKISLLALYFVIVTAGPCPILDLLGAEIFPLEVKSFMIAIVATVAGILQFLFIKFADPMIASVGYHGVFFGNASVIFACLIYMWFYVPETRGRSLPEIELYFKNGSFNYNKILLDSNQTNDLVKKDISF